jgi:hypothetical protein
MNDLLYPNPNRTEELLHDFNEILSQLSFVRRVMIFGSHARHEQDRWSDLDMIVVTNRRQDFVTVYETLCQHKPIVHHNPLTPQVEPCGGHLLGVIFEGESVFHNLDLNFLLVSEYQLPNALDRFGRIKTLYKADKQFETPEDEPTMISPRIENPDEIRISNALHWTKKSVKKALRQGTSLEDVKTRRDALKQVMDGYDEDIVLPNGNITRIAKTYIQLADLLLNNLQGNPL